MKLQITNQHAPAPLPRDTHLSDYQLNNTMQITLHMLSRQELICDGTTLPLFPS